MQSKERGWFNLHFLNYKAHRAADKMEARVHLCVQSWREVAPPPPLHLRQQVSGREEHLWPDLRRIHGKRGGSIAVYTVRIPFQK